MAAGCGDALSEWGLEDMCQRDWLDITIGAAGVRCVRPTMVERDIRLLGDYKGEGKAESVDGGMVMVKDKGRREGNAPDYVTPKIT